MKTMVLIATIIILSACAKDSGSNESGPSATQKAHQEVGQIKCSESVECTNYCKQTYPYVNPQLIDQECSRRGILGSGICSQMQEDNAQLGQQQIACLAQWINQ